MIALFSCILLFCIPVLGTPRTIINKDKVTLAVKRASITEMIFGLIILFGGMIFAHVYQLSGGINAGDLRFMFMDISFLWLVLSVHLYHGSNLARKILLVLSILRIPIIIGIPFSIISIYSLYFTRVVNEEGKIRGR